ncbi:MAG: SusC/RagA family TonB-linked outer membrane protein [Bacteroidales bacterium]|jgi:TonB-linked SusC/RagA family outer membrane protein
MKNFLTIIFLLAATTFALAQDNIRVSGTVKDNTGTPVAGASVFVKGTNINTITDIDGAFSITVKKGASISFVFTGYISQDRVANNADRINITLLEDNIKLQDIVFTGYSKQERRDITGSVATVKTKYVTSALSVDKLLAGQATGVYMSSSSGALGAANILTIRGISSIMGDNNPLYVIDGVPIYGTSRSENSTSTSGGSMPAYSLGGTQISSSITYNTSLNYSFEKNPLTSLNPEDIESIEILKDAFSTAIYGSRGSAGVILITTKKGSRDKTSVDVNYNISFENPLGKLSLLNGEQYNQIYSMYYPNSPFTSAYNTDWIGAVTRQAVSNNFSASVSGGTEKTNYFMSTSLSTNQSYIINNDLQRFSARVNLDSRLSSWATIGTNISLSKVDNNGLTAPNIYAMAAKKAPNVPIYNADGSYFYGQGTNPYGYAEAYNPVAMAYRNSQSSSDTRVVGNIYLDVKLTKWMTFRTDFGADLYNTKTATRMADVPLTEVIQKNKAQESVNMNSKFVINNTLNITKEIKSHFIQGIIGQSYETSTMYGNSITGSSFFSPYLIGVGAAQNKSVLAGGEQKWALFSAFARLNYQYKRKYLAGFTYRIDGSSRFNQDNRYLGTPSLSLGWRIGDEAFVKKNLKWIDELKLRASLGWSSKDGNSGYYGAQATYGLISGTSYAGSSFLQMSQPGNTNLGWEKTMTYDIGLDASFLKKRIDVVLDYYYRKTTDMLFGSDVPAYTGYTKQDQNIGDMSNQGIELKINSYNVMTKDFQWMTTVTLSRNTNKLLKLNFEGNQIDQLNSSYKYYAVGYAAGQFYLHKWAGIDPKTGDPLWEYKNGTISSTAPAVDSKTSNDNKFVMGVANPTFYGGLTNSLIYKGIELNFLFTFSYGGKMINNTQAQLMTYSQKEAFNLSTDILKFWQIYGHETGVPKLKNNSITGNYDYTASSTTTRFLEDNSFIRLKNLELAYSISGEMLKKIKVRQLRVFVLATNLLTLTKYSGIDPEVSAFGSSATSSGYDNLTMPQTRGLQFGVRIGF